MACKLSSRQGVRRIVARMMAVAVSVPLSACAGFDGLDSGIAGALDRSGPDAALVQRVRTAFTPLAQCVGRIIDQTYPNGMIEVAFQTVRDVTGPGAGMSKPLSDGASQWMIGVGMQMGPAVRILAHQNGRVRNRGPLDKVLVIDGAWTQHDKVSSSIAGRAKVRFQGVEFSLGWDRSYDLIAADFNWRRYGSSYIQGAVSTLAAISSSSGEGDLFMSEGDARGAATARVMSVEGLHITQRTIAEYSFLKILADAAGVPIEACAMDPASAPGFARDQLASYRAMSSGQRAANAQAMLRALGMTVARDGRWGHGSARALSGWLAANGHPPHGRLTSQAYVTLALAAASLDARGVR